MADEINNIKRLEDALLFGGGVLDELKIPFILVCGTLLGVLRDKHLIEYDHDVDVAVFDDDLTGEMKESLKENPASGGLRESVSGNGEITLIYNDKHFDIFILHKGYGKSFFNPIDDKCLVWDDDVFDKAKWKKTKYLGRKWNIPAKPIKFFRTYFGQDWKTPTSDFRWKMAPNFRTYMELVDEAIKK